MKAFDINKAHFTKLAEEHESLKASIHKLTEVIVNFVNEESFEEKDENNIDSLVENVIKVFLDQRQAFESVSRELSYLKLEAASLRSSKQTIQQTMSENDETFEKRESEMNNELNEVKKQCEDLEDKRNTLMGKLKKMVDLHHQLEEKEGEMEEELRRGRVERASLEEKYGQVVKECELLRGRIREVDQEVIISRESHRQEIQALKFELSSHDIEHQQALKVSLREVVNGVVIQGPFLLFPFRDLWKEGMFTSL